MLQDRHYKEKRALKQENQKLKNDIWLEEVSVVYIQCYLECCRSFYLWPITGSSECTLSSMLL
jgi:hypothetical protein